MLRRLSAAVGLVAAGHTGAALPPEPLPVPPPAPAAIHSDLGRILGFLNAAMPARIIDARTGRTVAPEGPPVRDAVADFGEAGAFDPLAYEVGVIHRGMLSAAAATGDPGFSDFTARQLRFIAAASPYFRAQGERFGMPRNSFRPVFAPDQLDDCGSMLAALIEAQEAGVGPDLRPLIRRWSGYIREGQFRLGDGTFARHRPQPVSVWADDMYMSIPALAAMGRLTGDPSWWTDGVRNVRGFSARLFRPAVGLYTHGWSPDSPDAPDFFWGRANGWAMLAVERLLDELPSNFPGRPDCLRLLQTHIRAVAALQSGDGRWHQMLNRSDSYLETSCSAMFVYGIAHAINQGWISPAVYGSIAQAGWEAVARQIAANGEVENTCVGTTLGATESFYYHRPVSVYALHGYGPVLLAGAEMIRLVRNPSIAIVQKNNLWQYIPK